MDQGFAYKGELFALAAPLVWSFAVILFRKTGERVGPIALNLFKNSVTLVLFLATLPVVGDSLLREVPSGNYWLLLASGAIGIGISDMLFFFALNRVGAGLWAIINTSYSPWIIFLSVLFLGERLTLLQTGGVVLILGAVLAVAWMRAPGGRRDPKALVAGLLFGTGAMFSQAVSIVMVKPLLDTAPLFWANVWRMAGGVLFMYAVLPLLPHRRRVLAQLADRRAWPAMIPATLLGTYVSLMFWLAGMKYTLASTASALNQTATLWTFLLAALLLREPVTWRRVVGLVIGFGGVLLVIFGQ
jgi:drug/metabolite transporter (DMT)-like permease